MTQKRATTEPGRPTPAQTPSSETALFLETTAQFHRLTGPPAFQDIIQQRIRDSDQVGTSSHVKREFDFVYGGFFETVIHNVGRLPELTTQRSCAGIWLDVQKLMPRYYSGGPSIFLSISLTLTEMLAGKAVAPTMLLNMLGGFRERLLRGFYWGEFFTDMSSCGLWPESPPCDCGPIPGDKCKLKDLCITSRAEFIASVKTLAAARREESRWLKENLPLIENARGTALMQIVCDHAGHFGDPIIFCEAPDDSTILTHDFTFRILHKAHPREGKVHILRLPRTAGGGACKILPEAAGDEVDGIILDHNAQGARIRAPRGSVKSRQRVSIKAQAFVSNGSGESTREARVLYFDKADKSVFAVRFPSPQRERSAGGRAANSAPRPG